MQKLGLDSKSTPKEESRLKEIVWPELDSQPNIESASDFAKWAAFIVAIFTGLAGILQVNLVYLFFSIVYFVIGWGFGRKSRALAGAGFGLMTLGLINQVVDSVMTMAAGSALGASFGAFLLVNFALGLIIPGVLTLLFLNGLRAALAHDASANAQEQAT